MPISFKPMREYMKTHNISFYKLANEGIDAQTLQRIRHDRAITTEYTTNEVAGVRTIHSFTKKAVDGQQDDTASEQNISFTVDFSQKYDGGTSNQISSGLENTVTKDLTDIYIYIYNNTLDSEFSVSNIKLERITE